MDEGDDVAAFSLALPDTVAGTHYGSPAVKVASNGRAFLAAGRVNNSFVLLIDLATKEQLIETDPDTFWQTAHYQGWPALLVRYGSADRERVRAMIERARGQAAARKPVKPRRPA